MNMAQYFALKIHTQIIIPVLNIVSISLLSLQLIKEPLNVMGNNYEPQILTTHHHK